MGHGHRRQAGDLHAPQLREHLLRRMLVAVAAAAVHQHHVLSRQQQGAGALPHVYGHSRQLALVILRRPQTHAQRQRQNRQHRGHGVLSGSVPRQDAQEEYGIHEHQPPDQKRIRVRIQGMERDFIRQGHHQQKQFAQKQAHIPQHMGSRQPREAQQHRQKSRHKIPRRQWDAHKARKRRRHGENAEIVRRQRHREHHGAQGGGKRAHQKAARHPQNFRLGLLLFLKIPADAGRQHDKPQHGGKAQLQAHAGRRIGVHQQDQQQRRRQRGDGVGIPQA